MSTMTWVLILLGSLLLMTTACCVYLLLPRNRSLKMHSPTRTSTPSKPSEVDPLLELTREMMATMREENQGTRTLMENLMLGRGQSSTFPRDESSTLSPTELGIYDPDSTPLSPGIEAIMERETEEDQLELSMRQRAELQDMLREKAAELHALQLTDQSTSEDFSPEPWSVPEASPDDQMSASWPYQPPPQD